MSLQIPFLIKLSPTSLTFIWFFSGMDSHMHSQTGTGGEPLPTHRARSVTMATTGRVEIVDIGINGEGKR